MAFPRPDAVFGDDIFSTDNMTDLYQLFGSEEARIIRELQHRFDILPVHRLVYYQSYNQGVLQRFQTALNTRSHHYQRRKLRSKLDLISNRQDCLGMTPTYSCMLDRRQSGAVLCDC